MKNVIPYNEDCFRIHERAVNKKQSGDLKGRLLKLNPLVEVEFNFFLEKFNSKKLGEVVPNAILNYSKVDLLTLYRYQSSVIVEVREGIRKLQIRTIINTCQNCTIDTANTLDHILPQSDYPEFVVNPRNLFPCCSTCNSYKLDSNENVNGQKFLNLYLDNLPKEQYLFVDVFLDVNNEIDFKFSLKNVGNAIPVEFFAIIESHYNKLHLIERMKLKSIEYVSELETKILTFLSKLSLNEILTDFTAAANSDKISYGENHWKCIVEIALLQSPIFISRINAK